MYTLEFYQVYFGVLNIYSVQDKSCTTPLFIDEVI